MRIFFILSCVVSCVFVSPVYSMYSAYGAYGAYGTDREELAQLPVKERIIKSITEAPSFDLAVGNARELLQESNQDIPKSIPDIIEQLSNKYTHTLLESQEIKRLRLTHDTIKEFKKIKAALALQLPQARRWLRDYSERRPELLGEYFVSVTRQNNILEALELLRTGLDFTQLPRLTVQQPAATPEQILGLKYLTVTPV